MEAGRELDALVAEKVMGWRRVTWNEINARLEGYPLDSNSNIVPKYSTDIAAAWEVMQMPIFDCWAVGRGSNGEWEVSNPWNDCVVIAKANTAPFAICLAAIKAMEGK